MFSIAHVTDAHLPPMPDFKRRDWSIKRILGYLSWHRNRKTRHSADVLKILKADLAMFAPDHIAVTGDQTNIALDAEYQAAALWMKDLGGAQSVTAIPGNHDAYRPDHDAAFQAHWADYARDDQTSPMAFPFVRKRGNIAFIGVNSAIQTPPFMAWGKVGADQLARLDVVLKALEKEGLARIVLIHHPPHENATAYRRSLLDAADFRGVIERAGAELILHGHLHKSVKASIKGPQGPVPVRGAGAASSNGQGHIPPAHYHMIKVAEMPQSWQIQIDHRQIDTARRVFATTDEEILNLPKPVISG
jgi:3',5'-cyclic AMP phosphodiesterase CpdA